MLWSHPFNTLEVAAQPDNRPPPRLCESALLTFSRFLACDINAALESKFPDMWHPLAVIALITKVCRDFHFESQASQ